MGVPALRSQIQGRLDQPAPCSRKDPQVGGVRANKPRNAWVSGFDAFNY